MADRPPRRWMHTGACRFCTLPAMAKKARRLKSSAGRRSKASAKPKATKPMRLTEEQFYEAKQAALEHSLGKMHGTVMHAIIPFDMGGGLDLYRFDHALPGRVYATQELIGIARSERPKKSGIGYCELVACVPPAKGARKSTKKWDESETELVNSLLNPIANYAFHAAVSPGETAEIPGDEGEENQCVVFDEFDTKGKPFEFAGERFGLLLCIRVLPSELAFARKKSGAALIEKLKAANVYPYSNLDRTPVV